MSVPFILNEFKYPQLNKKFFNINQTLKIKNSKPSIGYVGGSKTNTSDEFRSINLENFINFFKLDLNFYILQIDLTDKEKDFYLITIQKYFLYLIISRTLHQLQVFYLSLIWLLA